MGCGATTEQPESDVIRIETQQEQLQENKQLFNEMFKTQSNQLFNHAQQSGNFYEIAEKKEGFSYCRVINAYVSLEDTVDSIAKDFGYVDAIFVFYVYYLVFQPISFKHPTKNMLKYLSEHAESIKISLHQFLRITYICAPNQIRSVFRCNPLFVFFYAADTYFSGYADVRIFHNILQQKFRQTNFPKYPSAFFTQSELATHQYEHTVSVLNRISLPITVKQNHVRKFQKKIKEIKHEMRQQIDIYVTVYYNNADLNKINADNGMLQDLEMKAMDGELSLDD